MTIKHRLLRGRGVALSQATAETVLSGLVGQLIVVISGILVARMLGVQNRGQFALIALVPLVISQLGTLGLPVAMTYYIAQGVSSRRIISAAARQAIVQALVLVGAHAIIAWALFGTQPTEVKTAAALSLLVTPAAVLQVWGLALLQGERRFRSFNVLRLVGGGCYSAALAAIYLAHRGTILAATIAWVAGSLISCIAICGVALSRLPSGSVKDPAPPLAQMYRFGLKGLLGSVFPVETFQLDQFYIGLVLSPAALGLYVVGAAFTNLTRFFLPQSLGVVAYPQVAAAPNFVAARRTVWHFFLLTVGLCGAVIVALELSIGWVLPRVFGSHFAPAVPVARILLLGSLFLAGRRVLAEASRGAGFPGMGAASEIVAVLIAVPALAIASGGGLVGVTWALTIAYGSSLLIMMLATVAVMSGSRVARTWGERTAGVLRPTLTEPQAPAPESD